MPIEQVGALIAIYYLPQAWKFLWAPIVDANMTRKRWYVIGASMSAFGVLTMAAFSTHATTLAVLSAVSVMSSLAVSFLGMAVESLVAYGTPVTQKGRAAGWLQAGSLGGGGLGGGAALWLMQHVSLPWITGAALGDLHHALLPATAIGRRTTVSGDATARWPPTSSWMYCGDIWHVLRCAPATWRCWWCSCRSGQAPHRTFGRQYPTSGRASAAMVALINGAAGGIARRWAVWLAVICRIDSTANSPISDLVCS